MTLFVYVGGVDISNSIRLQGGIAELTEAADGEPNECQLSIDDPTGSQTFQALSPVIANETACSQPRCFTGIVTQAVQSRGPYISGAGRVWTLTISDLNERLHRRVLHASDAKRPAETGTARLNWLKSSVGLSGLVWDNGKVMANAWNYDATDYRDQYADDVLSSIVTAAAAGRWTTFAYWDPSAPVGQEPSLFYGEVTTTTYDSTLSISNVLSVVNNTTVFAPTPDTEVTSEAAPIYDGVLVTGPFGRLYRQLGSTFTTYGVHRDYVYDTIRNNNLTSASLHADSFLAHHAGAIDTISVTVRLPRDKVNLIGAGMRVAVYFSHLTGYDNPAFTQTRVTRRTFTFTDGTNEYYDVHLELSVRGIDQTGGGGNPGDFPHQINCVTATRVSGSDATASTNIGNLAATSSTAPTAGNLRIAKVWMHGPNDASIFTGKMAGWTLHPLGVMLVPNNPAQDAIASGMMALYYRTVEAGDSSTVLFGSTGSHQGRLDIEEFAGTWDVGSYDSVTSVATVSGTSFAVPCGSVTTTGTALLISMAALSGAPDTVDTATTSIGTITSQGVVGGGVGPPLGAMWDPVVAGTFSPTITYNCTSTNAVNGRIGITAAFNCTQSASQNPPDPAQPFGPISPVETPNGTLTTFTLPAGYEFADGSLRIYVDRQDQSAAITAYDGAARTFTLAFAPLTGWLIEAYGLGR